MSVTLKPGARFGSTTCDTEVVVVKGAGEVDLRCGGAPMEPVESRTPDRSTPAAPFDGGTLIGKRYANEDGSIELLCSKAGDGSLALGDAPIEQKGAKPLPSSD